MTFWNAKQDAAPAASREEPKPMARITRDELPASLGGTSDLLLGPGAEFDGKLTFRGTVRIDARFTGSIVTDDVLVVGEHARIDAEITCGTIVVHGQVKGNVRARTSVELHGSAQLVGDVETPSLSMDQGTVLQGALRMDGADQGAPRFVAPPAIAALK